MTTIVPGNYPAEFELKGKPSKSPQPGFENHYKIILATDLRRFTETMKSLRKPEQMGVFLSNFFDKSAETISGHNGCMNKYLGDGYLAHFTVDSARDLPNIAKNIIRSMFKIHADFDQLRTSFDFKLLGLSTVLSLDPALVMGRLGAIIYTDFTMIGRGVNATFRALDHAKGSLILIFQDLVQYLNDEWVLIDLETQTYDGIYEPIKLFSVLREKTPLELRWQAERRDEYEQCPDWCKSYRICRRAWQQGQNGGSMTNCQQCNEERVHKCGIWDECTVKWHYGKAHKDHSGFECCHICDHFKQCYHSFSRGRLDRTMIRCTKMIDQ